MEKCEKLIATPVSFGELATAALVELLERRHLFQTVHVEVEKALHPLPKRKRIPKDTPLLTRVIISSIREFPEQSLRLENLFNKARYESEWKLSAAKVGEGEQCSSELLVLPTLRAACGHCGGQRLPHRPVSQAGDGPACLYSGKNNKELVVQVFALSYQCQGCLREPIVFLVRREGFKLMLVGRSQFEPVATPSCIPKALAGHYRDAEIAFRTGHCLAALFYLRTFIEQHMRRIVRPVGRMSGEELASAYQKGLPPDFLARFPSLKKIYGDLSAAIHEDREDEQMFADSLGEVRKHFEAAKVFGIRTHGQPIQPEQREGNQSTGI